MKKISTIICIVIIFFVGCTTNHVDKDNKSQSLEQPIDSNSTLDNKSRENAEEDVDYDKNNSNEVEERSQKSNERDTEIDIEVDKEGSTKVANLYNGGILYFGGNHSIYIEQEDNTIVLQEYLASYPEISPNNKLIAYIDEDDFETVGDLYIYDISTNEDTKKTNFEDFPSETVKVIEWLDDNHILLIAGFADGTVSQGGDLYCYDLSKDTLELIIDVEKDTEITDIEVKRNKITLTKIIWLDNNYTEYKIIEEEMTIEDIL